MATGPANPMKLRPAHIEFIRLHIEGKSNIEIAMLTDYTPQRVCDVLGSPEAQAIISQLKEDAIEDTSEMIQKGLSEMAPGALNVLGKQIYSGNEYIAHKAAVSVMYMAGHAPVRRTRIETATKVEKDYEKLSEEEIRAKLLADLTGDIGPDGRPLN
jgi:hypothetical protein